MSIDVVSLDRRLPSLGLAFGALALIVATVGGALAFQAAGIAPCELCLKERWPYYAGMAVAALAVAAAWRGSRSGLVLCLAILAVLFLGSSVFGGYHAGVEWGWWAGPSDCTGPLDRAGSMGDFMAQLRTVHVVRCDAVAIRILGLSLAGWNAVISLIIAGIATTGALLSTRSIRPRFAAGALGE